MTTFTVTPCTQDQLQKLIVELLANQTNVTKASFTVPNSYNIVGHGIAATAILTEDTLTVNILHKPFYIPESMIEDSIRKALGA
jgi:hypothetical protein